MTINDLWDMYRKLQERASELESRLESLENTVGDHGSQLDELPRDIAEKSDIADLESRIDDLDSRIDNIGD